MISKFKRIGLDIVKFLRTKIISYKENKFVKNKIKTVQIYEGSDKEYKEQVLPFWSKYNKKPDKAWFQYFGYNINKFDPYIIPGDLFYSELLFYLTNTEIGKVVSSKIYADYILEKVNKPLSVLKYSNKFLVNSNTELINKDSIRDIISKYDRLIIKPTNLLKGEGVRILKLEEDFDNEYKYILKKINSNEDFIIQELVKQNKQLSNYNPTSLNTIRLITLLIDDKVVPLSAILRVGAIGKEVDNYNQGGYSRPIDENGYLGEYAMQNEMIIYQDHDGKKFEKEKLVDFEKIIEVAKECHPYFLDLRWIGWDFALDENNNPVFIELNDYSGDNQREVGPSFGDLTPKILDEYFEYKNSK